MEVSWDDRLLTVALARARSWAGDNPITYSIVFGVPAIAIQAAITFGVLQGAGLVAAIVSVVIVPILIVGFMLGAALLQMLYEVRAAMGQLLDPTPVGGPADNFTCELADHDDREIAIRVTNHEAAGDFHAKVVDLTGADRRPVPISIRWRDDAPAPVRRINQGDSEVLRVIRLRGRRRVDFLEPAADGTDCFCRVVAVDGHTGDEANGANGNGVNGHGHDPAAVGGRLPTVAAVVQVFNRRDDAEGSRSHLLELVFDERDGPPRTELRPMPSRPEPGSPDRGG